MNANNFIDSFARCYMCGAVFNAPNGEEICNNCYKHLVVSTDYGWKIECYECGREYHIVHDTVEKGFIAKSRGTTQYEWKGDCFNCGSHIFKGDK